MDIQIKVTFATLDDGKFTKDELIKALCYQFQCGGEVWLTITKDSETYEVAALAIDAEATIDNK